LQSVLSPLPSSVVPLKTMDQLNQDFREFIGLLEEENVEYLIVGGYAVGIHGFPRYTGDIDFFVALNPENADRLIRVFDRFGFGEIGLSPTDFLEENFVVEIGREPRKIQVLTGIDGVRFAECHRNRIEIEIESDGLVLKVIGKNDLIRNKAASGRPKDQIDLSELQKG
jgi:predicted nucleotidyltransferase